MYHLSGISTLTHAGRSRSNSLASGSSVPLSPSVLDFSEYVSRKCEKKLQRRVRQLSQKCNKQQAAIAQLKQQLAAARNNRQPLTDVSNVMATALLDDGAEAVDTAEGEVGGVADDTTDETGLELLNGTEEEEEEAEKEEVEVEEGIAEGGQTDLAAVSDSEEGEASKGNEQQHDLDDATLQPQAEGQQRRATKEEAVTNECVASPPCSPISAGRHKRARTDDSVQCNTELIDAQWKKAKDDNEDEYEQQSDEQHVDDQPTAAASVAETAPSVAQPAVAALLPFKAAFLHPFPTSHAHMQGNNAGSVLTPYRGLMRPFPLAQLNHSPVRIPQPALYSA